jgi:hypothetical protein
LASVVPDGIGLEGVGVVVGVVVGVGVIVFVGVILGVILGVIVGVGVLVFVGVGVGNEPQGTTDAITKSTFGNVYELH